MGGGITEANAASWIEWGAQKVRLFTISYHLRRLPLALLMILLIPSCFADEL